MAGTESKRLKKAQSGEGIVLSSRVRLARNVADHPFPGWLKKTQRNELYNLIHEPVQNLRQMRPTFLNRQMDGFGPLDKQVLVEQHLISREHAAKNAGSGVIISKDQTLSIMINEEDHLRLQSIRPGYALEDAWDNIDRVDTQLESILNFAFSPTLGYLTACPTNVGTGMRASVMLHLPGLVLGDQINKVIKSVNQIGLAVRGLYGEGTEALGNLFQISNQMTLGESERQILDRLTKITDHLIEHEVNARQKLLQERGRMVADQFGRAYGILGNAYSITSKEALNMLSLLILGVDLGVLPTSLKTKFDDLFIQTQPAHLQKLAGRKLNAEERDSMRADVLRDTLKSVSAPNTRKIQITKTI